jgi:hypothetical protein
MEAVIVIIWEDMGPVFREVICIVFWNFCFCINYYGPGSYGLIILIILIIVYFNSQFIQNVFSDLILYWILFICIDI